MQTPAPAPAATAGATSSAPRRSVRRRVLRWTFGVLAALIVLLAMALGALRLMLIQVPEYRTQIQAWVNETTHLDVRFRTVDARWRAFGPELYFTDAQVFAPDGGPLLARARAASVGVDLPRVLFRAELLAGRIRLIEPRISLVRTLDGRIELEGQAALDPRDSNRFNVHDLPTGELQIVDAHVSFQDLRREMGALALDHVNLTLARDRNDVSLEGEIDLPERLGRELEFSGAAAGRLDEPHALDWTAQLDARELQLAGWKSFFGTLLHAPVAGQGDLYARVGFKGSQVNGGELKLQLQDVALLGEDSRIPAARYRRIAGEFQLERRGEQLLLEGKDVELSTEQKPWQPSRASIAWTMNAGQVQRLEAEAAFVQLENLLPVATAAPKAPWRERVLGFAPSGEVRALRASYARAADGAAQVTVAARLKGVGFQAHQKIPGVRGLDGELALTPTSGRLSVDSKGFGFALPHVFREPLRLDVATGQLVWNREQDGWHVSTRQFLLRNAHVTAATDAELYLPADGAISPVLKLRSRFSDVVLKEGWRYLPVNKLQGKTLEWLDAAFLAGRAPSGEFVFDGPTRAFPFRDGGGEFRVSFPVEGLRLHYAQGWPEVENLLADIEFKNQGLTGELKGGTLNGLRLTEGTAQFVDFRTGELTIKARAHGDLGAALGYVQTSPVGEGLGRQFMALRGTGATGVSVDLMLPVKDMQQRRIDVAARLADAQISLQDTQHALAAVQGTFRLRDREISLPDGLSGTYLGGRVRVDAAAESANGRTENVIRVRAQTPASALAQAVGIPQFVGLDGTLDWRGTARLPIGERRAGRAPSVRVESSLRGARIGLPAPFDKSASSTQPLRIDVEWPTSGEAQVRASYGNEARARLRVVARDGTWQFARGVLRFGDGDTGALPAADGLEVRGALPSLRLSEWFALGSGASGSTRAGKPVSSVLRSADLTVAELEVFGFEFANVSASLLAGERSWSVNVDGPRARGSILVPYDFAGPEPLLINMARLSIGDAEALAIAGAAREGAAQKGASDADPRRWPSVRASVGQFEAWGKRLGFVRAELVRGPDGLTLQSFAAQAATFAANGTGTWLAGTQQGMHGTLALKLESTDVQQTLLDLGYGAALTGKKGLVDANLNWAGAPDGTLPTRLAGNIRVEIDDGQLLNVQPGAGRVFGLMSVAALPRRLSLDFSDFVSKGLSFDSIRGDFQLLNGDAYTSNLLLKGPAAEIGIVGRTGLGTRDYDQTAVVTGSVGNSLPVVGALAGGPVVGAAVLLFSQVFKEPLKGIARGYYKITGPWENPTVVRVDRAEGKKAGDVRTAEGKNIGAN